MPSERPATPASSVETELAHLLEPLLADQGLVLEGVSLKPAGSRRVLRVLVDVDPFEDGPTVSEPVEGLSLDEVADAARLVGEHLDSLAASADPLGSAAYTLEVSTPGVDRPLREPRQFARNVDRLVELILADGSSLRGRVAAVSGEALTVRPEPAKGAVPGGRRAPAAGASPGPARELGWAEVDRGVVQVEFNRPARASSSGAAAEELDTEESDDGSEQEG